MLSDLKLLYGKEKAAEIEKKIKSLIIKYRKKIQHADIKPLSEEDSVFITYGDSIKRGNEMPLRIMDLFSGKYLVEFSSMHILPFFPYESDRGFSVKDFREVDPSLGTWRDIKKLAGKKKLMVDLVINHISDRSRIFQKYLAGDPKYRDFFIEFDPSCLPAEEDLRKVTRPRTEKLLVKYNTSRGEKYLWRTFLNDQIDLNYRNPSVLTMMIENMLLYISKGASMIRLDAIAFVWKELGTSCVHLPQTHAIVRIFRSVAKKIDKNIQIIPETNVSFSELLPYFGKGTDEASMMYNFTLPPLTLYSFITGNAAALSKWASSINKIPKQCTWFNFLDSHDGIGLRPVESILDKKGILLMTQNTLDKGGRINNKSNPDGTASPYELNTTWWSFLEDNRLDEELMIKKYIASRAVALSLPGVPGVYIHGLFGSKNNIDGVNRTNHNRDINRQDLYLSEVEKMLQDRNSMAHRIYTEYVRLLGLRKNEPAFDPFSECRVLDINGSLFALVRFCKNGPSLLSIINVSHKKISAKIHFGKYGIDRPIDIISGKKLSSTGILEAEPYQVLWIKSE